MPENPSSPGGAATPACGGGNPACGPAFSGSTPVPALSALSLRRSVEHAPLYGSGSVPPVPAFSALSSASLRLCGEGTPSNTCHSIIADMRYYILRCRQLGHSGLWWECFTFAPSAFSIVTTLPRAKRG